MKVVVTGADGFLGWHLRGRLRALTDHEVIPVTAANWADLDQLAAGADALVHLAGINRADEAELTEGNVRLAEEVSRAVRTSGVSRVLYANSIQAGNGSAYGRGKERAAQILGGTSEAVGACFVDVVLPNLFGEHGRPDYNSFVATFADRVSRGEMPSVTDREVGLLHVQDAAASFIEALESGVSSTVRPEATPTSVSDVLDILRGQYDVYQRGDIPALSSRLEVSLFNTLRAAMFPQQYPIALARRSDPRGSLVETVRAHGSEGQTFVSTTVPGVTRGQHFHLRKVERFVVVGGRARISLRRLFSNEVVSFDVTGEQPVIVDMPTLWVHNLTNTGDSELTTLFWTNELFDPQDTDTFPEDV